MPGRNHRPGPPPLDTATNTEFRRRVPEADRQGITAQETFDLAYRAAQVLLDELEAILRRGDAEDAHAPPRRHIRPPRQRSAPAND